MIEEIKQGSYVFEIRHGRIDPEFMPYEVVSHMLLEGCGSVIKVIHCCKDMQEAREIYADMQV